MFVSMEWAICAEVREWFASLALGFIDFDRVEYRNLGDSQRI